MPIFECQKCGKIDVVLVAMCEGIMVPLRAAARFDADNNPIYSRTCLDCQPLKVEIVKGDLLDQKVDVIVNAWNRNLIPWWLLTLQGVSGAIKERGGTTPFIELAKHGPMPLGTAVLTSAGNLPFKGIIHVAGINLFWRASERSIRNSVRNAIQLAYEKGFTSMAFPLIGAGSGGLNQNQATGFILYALDKLDIPMTVKVVVFKGAKR